MTDPDTTLGRIDDLLAGADWEGTDAMRWAPPEQALPEEPEIPPPPDSLAADLARIGNATREMGRIIAAQVAPITNAIGAALELEHRLDLLQALVPDDTERAAYWTAARGNLDRAIELAQTGEPLPEPTVTEPSTARSFPRFNMRIVTDRSTT